MQLKLMHLMSGVVHLYTGAEVSQAGQQQPANSPLIPPPKQPASTAGSISLAAHGSQAAAAAKPKSKKVYVTLFPH